MKHRKVLTMIFSLGLSFGTAKSYATGCADHLLGAKFLHDKNQNLFKSGEVQKSTENQKALKQPEQKIHYWLNELEKSYKEKRENPESFNELKRLFLDQYVTKANEISESFFELQIRVARELGRGNINLAAESRSTIAETAVKDQTDSLKSWLNYLFSKDADIYPMWIKHWVLNSVTKLSNFDPETKSFKNRSKGQGSAFPELNQEALSMVINAIVNKVHGKSLEDIKDPEILHQLQNPSFANMYSRAWVVAIGEKRDLSVTEGKWVKFKKGSEPDTLVNSLQGMNTGWCTAGYSTAESQLSLGDLYIYYSLDKNNRASIPRLAIRMEDLAIAEVRGVAKDQNLDSDMATTNILREKLEEFGDEGRVYQKKSRDMKTLTIIEKKVQKIEPLSKEDLRFLYEIDEEIQGFGYDKDPRIKEITAKRNRKSDVALALSIKESQVSLTKKEALNPDTIYHYGDLDFGEIFSADGLRLPQYVSGFLYLPNLKSAEAIKLPKHVGGSLNLNSLGSVKELTLPRTVGGNVNLPKLTDIDKLIFPQSVGGNIVLSNLRFAKELTLPQHVGGALNLENLESAKGLKLPDYVGGILNLRNLNHINSLIFPKYVGRNLSLDRLSSAESLKLPEHIGGTLYLNRLTYVEELILPGFIGESLVMSSYIPEEGLKLILPRKNGHGFMRPIDV